MLSREVILVKVNLSFFFLAMKPMKIIPIKYKMKIQVEYKLCACF